jgi:hypothetical protein
VPTTFPAGLDGCVVPAGSRLGPEGELADIASTIYSGTSEIQRVILG